MGRNILTALFVSVAVAVMVQLPGHADLASPGWFDPDGVSVGDDWHYRVPITIAAGDVGDSVIETITYATLLSDVGVTGTFDVDSIRLARSNGTTLVAKQNFTDSGATGEFEFVLEDAAPTTYYLYFDIDENSAAGKPAGPSTADPWWDVDWLYRVPITIDNSSNSSSFTEYQIRLEIDNSHADFWANVDPDGDDIRFVESDGTTVDDYFIESFDSASDEAVIWVQAASLPASGSATIYMYYGNVAAADASDELATFSYATAKPVKYALHDNLTSAEVISYADGNTVIRSASMDCIAAATLNLDEGDRGTFNSVGQSNVFCATKPFSGRGRQNYTDALVPISFAGTQFVLPTERYTNTVSLLSPFGTASVNVYTGTSLVGGSPFSVGSSAVTVTADSSGNSIIVESDIPILVTHESANDGFVAYRATTEELFGIPSNYLYVGYADDGISGTVVRSSGLDVNFSGNRGVMSTVLSSAGAQGSAPAVVVSANGPIGAIQQADSDGVDSTVFLPERELDDLYYIPTTAQYIAVACPDPGTLVSVNGGAAQSCSGTGVGKVLFNAGYAAGAKVEADAPIFIYYEDTLTDGSGDETNVWGMKSNRQYTYPEPSPSLGSQEEVVDATVGTAAGFGINIDAVEEASVGGILRCGDTVEIRVVSDVGMYLDDVAGDTIEVDVEDSLAAAVATVTLYDDGSNGDASANDGTYTNNNAFTISPIATGGLWQATAKAGSTANGFDNGYNATDVSNFTVVCDFQPDLQIRAEGEVAYVGDGQYPPTLQQKQIAVDLTDSATFEILLENESLASDDFTVTGTAGGSAGGGTFTVQYIGIDGASDVTAQVVGAGYAIAGVAAGDSETMKIVVTSDFNVDDGTAYDVDLTAVSDTNAAAVDTVRARTRIVTIDTDGDGLSDNEEALIGTDPNDPDSDGDTISDGNEVPDPLNPPDTDFDTILDVFDLDSDGDTILDSYEAGDSDVSTDAIDTDGDGTPDFLDLDSDGDGLNDLEEAGDSFLQTDPVDSDGDGVPNYLDPFEDPSQEAPASEEGETGADAITGAVSGGCNLVADAPAASGSLLPLMALAGLALFRRRK